MHSMKTWRVIRRTDTDAGVDYIVGPAQIVVGNTIKDDRGHESIVVNLNPKERTMCTIHFVRHQKPVNNYYVLNTWEYRDPTTFPETFQLASHYVRWDLLETEDLDIILTVLHTK
jgi:hypothetical protein